MSCRVEQVNRKGGYRYRLVIDKSINGICKREYKTLPKGTTKVQAEKYVYRLSLRKSVANICRKHLFCFVTMQRIPTFQNILSICLPLNNLHSKDRDRFIEVTPTAITKVSVPEMDTFSIEDAAIIENKMQMVLLLAMSGNNSNEVCLAYNVGNSDEFVTLYGSDNEIDFSCSSDMWNMVCVNNNENLNNVIVLHNHPTLNSFSVYDVLEFCKRPNIRLLGVATNLGKCYYLEKTDSTKISLWRAEFISEMNKGYRTDITREEVINLTISSIKKACMKCNGVKYYD